MNTNDCKTILYIAMSQDGFIAGENDDISFLDPFQTEGEDYGYNDFIQSVGAILVGRKTYEKVIGMGYPYHPNLPVYVITRKPAVSKSENLIFCNNELHSLITQLKRSQPKNIYCDGGAELANSLIEKKLIDYIILSVIPTKLHRGIPLFTNGIVPSEFSLKTTKSYQNGLIQYTYEI